jgi:hypothetical protein
VEDKNAGCVLILHTVQSLHHPDGLDDDFADAERSY